MFMIIKKAGKRVFAYQLGKPHEVLTQLIAEGKIVAADEETYEIFSEEAFHGQSGKGEIAHSGDYIKISTSGFPYPNKRDYFLKNHRQISENEYEQIPRLLNAWDISEPMCDEIEFLMQKKGLQINPDDSMNCFSAFLWGTKETAPQDAVIVFYSILRNHDGRISDADFNFVVRGEFERFYDIC